MIRNLFRKFLGSPKHQTVESTVNPLLSEVSVDTVPKPTNEPRIRQATYQIGQVVHHRVFDFRGVIFDVDPEYSNSEDWYESIPEDIRPHRDQPYYHLFAENEDGHYTAYVSEQNLVPDKTDAPIKNPDLHEVFTLSESGDYLLRAEFAN